MSQVTVASLLKQARRLDRKVERERSGLFIVEGLQNIVAAKESGADIVGILFSEGFDAADLSQLEIPIFEINEKDFRSVSDTVTPQGVLAVVKLQPYLLSDIPSNARLIIFLEEVRDPGNLGTIIRTADAFGADAVLLSPGSVDPYNDKSVRSSAGSIFHIPVVRNVALSELMEMRNGIKGRILATSLDGDSTIEQVLADSDSPFIWVIGNEASGVSAELKSISDKKVRIPMHGKAESLNAAVAATVCLFASAAQIYGPKA